MFTGMNLHMWGVYGSICNVGVTMGGRDQVHTHIHQLINLGVHYFHFVKYKITPLFLT